MKIILNLYLYNSIIVTLNSNNMIITINDLNLLSRKTKEHLSIHELHPPYIDIHGQRQEVMMKNYVYLREKFLEN